MAAVFHPEDRASPLSYDPTETALLLLDFQGFTIKLCGSGGNAATAKAKTMRDWALSQRMMVLHSVVDVNGKPPPICKGIKRLEQMLAEVVNDREAAEEPTELAFSMASREYIVLKQPGTVSGLKSKGAKDLLDDYGIKSLIICGLSTTGAVLPTAASATDDGYVVTVIRDACADRTRKLHDVVMDSILPNRAHITTADEFISEWAKCAKA